MPDHQSHRLEYNNNNKKRNDNNNNNNSNNSQTHKSHTYSKLTLLAHKPKQSLQQTQLIMTSTLSNNLINNYNLEHTQNRIKNNSNKTRTHYRITFKHTTHSSQSKCNSKLNAFRGDSPRTGAAAPLPRGNNWRVPRYSCTTDPLGSDAPSVQLHYGALGTPSISKPTTTAVPTTTTNSSTKQDTQETQQQQQQPQQTQHTQTQQQEQQQQHPIQHMHTGTQETINTNNNDIHNNNDNTNFQHFRKQLDLYSGFTGKSLGQNVLNDRGMISGFRKTRDFDMCFTCESQCFPENINFPFSLLK
jgi:hypothetical protein